MSHRYLLLIVLAWLFSLTPAHAESLASTIFKQSYGKVGSIYRAGQCGRNVKMLALELNKYGVDIRGSSVLFLLGESRSISGVPGRLGGMRPAAARNQVREWDFHVVLRMTDFYGRNSYILDLDGPAQPMPIEDYFRVMFPNQGSQDRLKAMKMREVDTVTYLRSFEEYYSSRDPRASLDDNWVVGDYRNASGPAMSVREYLSHLR